MVNATYVLTAHITFQEGTTVVATTFVSPEIEATTLVHALSKATVIPLEQWEVED